MQALTIETPNSDYKLKVSTGFAIPEPKSGEVRIKVAAASLNPVDFKLAKLGHSAWTFPHVLGTDVAGVIDKIGEGSQTEQGLKVGDNVIAFTDIRKNGSLAGYVVVPSAVVAAAPKSISLEAASTLPCSGITAYLALFKKLHVQKGHRDSILITGVRGGVGLFAIKLAALHCKVVIASCAPEYASLATALGATHTIDPTKESVKGRTLEITEGAGVNSVLDLVSQESATKVAGALAYDGAIACVAALPDTSSALFPKHKQISIHEIQLVGAYEHQNVKALNYIGKLAGDLSRLVDQFPKLIPEYEVIALGDVEGALKQLEAKTATKKFVVNMQ